MPKRIIDGEALWTSDKLAKLPAEFQPEYANIIPLALADGCFECDPKLLWRTVYAYNRSSITPVFVEKMLEAFESVGLIKRFEHKEKKWGFFIGIDKPGRLPETSKRNRYTTSGVPPEYIRSLSRHEGFGLDRKGLEEDSKPLSPILTEERGEEILAEKGIKTRRRLN